MNAQCRRVNVQDLCTIERAKLGKIYRAGTCFVKLSAVDEFVGQLQTAGEIDSRYAAIEPKKEMNLEYLYIAINRKFPEFLRKYRTTINLQESTLKHFTIDWHGDKKVQEKIVKEIDEIEKEINLTERQIDCEKEMKKWYLSELLI